VRFIGVGEQADDLQPFDPRAFAEAMFSEPESKD
jgi:signal recognition particle GTPase